jgi:formylmethanofuran dehydrogenase subunit E-like metal-binding protein
LRSAYRWKVAIHMTNEEKKARIHQWIDPEERVTVQFLDASDLNATVTNCTDQLVDLSIETHVPYLTQHISVPLSHVDVTEDFSHYTRDPERPLQRQRLMLLIDEKRPGIIY